MELRRPSAPAASPQENYISNSKESIIIKKLLTKLEAQGLTVASLTEEEILAQLGPVRMPGVTADSVIAEMKKAGIIPPPKKVIPPPEKISLKVNLGNVKHVEDAATNEIAANRLKEEDQRKERRQKKIAEENEQVNQLEKDIFKDNKDLDLVYVQALALNNENEREKPEYYGKFASIIKGGEAEIRKDLEDLALRQQQFKDKQKDMDAKMALTIEKNAKIASIVEQSLAYGVSELNWYGSRVKVSPASKFDDIKRGVDDVLEIQKSETENKYMGLGIDVTYNGLMSEKYRDKFERLLESIRTNKKTRIKYFTNSKGEMMPEFPVPKIVLHFNGQDVKDLAHFVKHIGNAEVKQKFAESPMKIEVLNQIMIQCEMLAAFADECGNSIGQEYREISNTIEELASKHPEIRESLDARHSNETTERLKHITEKFKEIEVAGRPAMTA